MRPMSGAKPAFGCSRFSAGFPGTRRFNFDTLFIRGRGRKPAGNVHALLDFRDSGQRSSDLLHGRVEKRTWPSHQACSALAIAGAVQVIHSSDQQTTTVVRSLLHHQHSDVRHTGRALGADEHTVQRSQGKAVLPIIFSGMIAGRIAAGLSLNWLAAIPVPDILRAG